jgi:hypothetical protein
MPNHTYKEPITMRHTLTFGLIAFASLLASIAGAQCNGW